MKSDEEARRKRLEGGGGGGEGKGGMRKAGTFPPACDCNAARHCRPTGLSWGKVRPKRLDPAPRGR